MATGAVGVDVGGLSVKGVRLGRAGGRWTIVARAQRRLTEGGRGEAAVVAAAADLARELCAGDPLPVGLGVAGIVDGARGVVVKSPNFPAWSDFDARQALGDAVGRPVAVDNDANTFLLAEATLGAAAGARHVVALTLGTGIGGAALVDGRLLRGRRGMAAEMGHMPFVAGGAPCGCGTSGCIEQYASTLFLDREATASSLSATRGADRADVGRLLSDAARDGDQAAIALWRRFGENLGVHLAGLVNLFDPEAVLIGGGLAAAWEHFAPAARAMTEARAFEVMTRDLRWCRASLGADAGAVGAALLAVEGAAEGPAAREPAPG